MCCAALHPGSCDQSNQPAFRIHLYKFTLVTSDSDSKDPNHFVELSWVMNHWKQLFLNIFLLAEISKFYGVKNQKLPCDFELSKIWIRSLIRILIKCRIWIRMQTLRISILNPEPVNKSTNHSQWCETVLVRSGFEFRLQLLSTKFSKSLFRI